MVIFYRKRPVAIRYIQFGFIEVWKSLEYSKIILLYRVHQHHKTSNLVIHFSLQRAFNDNNAAISWAIH